MYEDSCLCHRTRMASRAVSRLYDQTLRSVGLRATQLAVLVAVGNEGWRRSRTVECTKKGRTRLREALPFWEKAQETMRRKLGSRRWPVIMADLNDLIRAA